MNKKARNTSYLLSGLIGLGLGSASAGTNVHIIKEGEIFSKIVQDYSQENELLNYRHSFTLFKKINQGYIQNFDHLKKGDKIFIPTKDDIKNYLEGNSVHHTVRTMPDDDIHVVQPGDTLLKVAVELSEEKYRGLISAEQIIKKILEKNDKINNMDLIVVGQHVALPNITDFEDFAAEETNTQVAEQVPLTQQKQTSQDGQLVFNNMVEYQKESIEKAETRLQNLRTIASVNKDDNDPDENFLKQASTAYERRLLRIKEIEKKLKNLKREIGSKTKEIKSYKKNIDDVSVLSRYYIIKPGDTLDIIVDNYLKNHSNHAKSAFKQELKYVNKIEDENLIFVGHKLYFPKQWSTTSRELASKKTKN